jgi:uncharacterized protein (UPF0332 family)
MLYYQKPNNTFNLPNYWPTAAISTLLFPAYTTLCFTIAEVLLDRLGFTFSSHHAVIAAYGLHFAKTQALHPRFHRVLIDAFEKRQLGDYTVDSGLTQDDADNLLIDATEFLAVARQWLENNPAPSQ